MDKDSKKIFERQNEPEMLDAQKTASCCYSSGKKIVFLLAIFSIVIPIIINILVATFPSKIMANILAIVACLCFIGGEIIRKKIDKCKENGAGLQQYFDEYVFGLKNTGKKYFAIKQISKEKRLELIEKYSKKKSKDFKDWYNDYSQLSYEKAVYHCQKENIRWDRKIREIYLIVLIIFIAVLLILFIINACFHNDSVNSLIAIVVTIAPLVSFLWNGIKKNWRDIKFQKNLYNFMEIIEEEANKQQVLWDEIEELQVEIQTYRQKAYLIPDWFYKILKKPMQRKEKGLAERICKEENRK